MIQTAIPNEDLLNTGNWQYRYGPTGDSIFPGIADPSDEEWIISPNLPSSALYVVKLTELAEITEQGDWNIKIRMRKAATTATRLDLTLELRQLYIDEADPGELVHSETIQDVPDVLTDYEFSIVDTSSIVSGSGGELVFRIIADTI